MVINFHLFRAFEYRVHLEVITVLSHLLPSLPAAISAASASPPAPLFTTVSPSATRFSDYPSYQSRTSGGKVRGLGSLKETLGYLSIGPH